MNVSLWPPNGNSRNSLWRAFAAASLRRLDSQPPTTQRVSVRNHGQGHVLPSRQRHVLHLGGRYQLIPLTRKEQDGRRHTLDLHTSHKHVTMLQLHQASSEAPQSLTASSLSNLFRTK